MKRALLSGLSTLLLPFSAHAATTAAGGYLMRGGYQPRSYMRVTGEGASAAPAAMSARSAPPAAPRTETATSPLQAGDLLDIRSHPAVTELVVVDSSVPDKAALYRGLNPGVAMVEIDAGKPGLPQLLAALKGHHGLDAVHIVSHAEAGVLRLGNSRLTADDLQHELGALAALRDSVRAGGDLLFYGCDLAADAAGEAMLDILHDATGLDVAASNNPTGSAARGGDWSLEIQRGRIDAGLAFSDKALRDFSGVLGTYTLSNFAYNGNSYQNNAYAGPTVSSHCPSSIVPTYAYGSLSSGNYIVCGLVASNGFGGDRVNVSNRDITQGGSPSNAYLMTASGAAASNNAIEVRASSGNFRLTRVVAQKFAGAGAFANVRVVGELAAGGTVSSTTMGDASSYVFGPTELAAFAGQNITKFRLVFDNNASPPSSPAAYLGLASFDATQDTTPPTVSGASSYTANGAYKVGDVIAVHVSFSEPVNVAGGTPTITLETGATDRVVNYSSGSGGSELVFNYTVQPGDTASDLDYLSTAALALNGATIRDGSGNNATLTLPQPGTANSLGANKNIVVDGVAPTVSSLTSSTVNGTYKIGDSISIQLSVSEIVTVTGTPQLTLETGTTDRVVDYDSGSGSNVLNFVYTVQAGDIASDLDYVSTNALALNGGTLRDAAGNNATLTLPSPGASNSLGANSALVIDGVAPVVTSTAPSGGAVSTDTSVDFTVNFSEPVANISVDDFTLTATGSAAGSIASVSASSGSAVTVTVASITGSGTLRVDLNGGTNISDAAGNVIASYGSGSTHTVVIPTAPDAPTIGTATAGDGQASVTFAAPLNSGGSAISLYTATASPGGATGSCAGPAACTITVGSLTNGTAYTFTVTATNAIGTSLPSAASASVTPKGDQTIAFADPGAQNFNTAPTLMATASSGLTVAFTSSSTAVCTITTGGTLTFLSAGACTIDANQAGNGAWNAAPTVSRTFTVNAVVPAAPTIGTATADNGQATVAFTVPASDGGSAITGYMVTSSPGGFTGTGTGSPITVAGLTNGTAYTFTVTATNSAGTGPASAASNAVTPQGGQIITFANPGAQNFGTTPTLTATASSGLTVTFGSSTPGVCAITPGGALTFVSTGNCTIDANQAGNGAYLPAPQISQTFTVNAVVPAAPTIGTATAGDAQATVAFTAPAFDGGSAIIQYTATSSPGGFTGSSSGSPIVVTGLTNGVPYTFTVTASNSGGTGAASTASNAVTPKGAQTIVFANPGNQLINATPTLSASASSGLAVVFSSSTPGVCTVTSGGALTFLSVGTCTIAADQAGDGTYLAAPQVSESFLVEAVASNAPSIGTATAGDGQATVTFTAPAFDGGSPITSYTVTSAPGGIVATGSGSPIIVTGLTNGTAYTFTVTATNGAGTGPASAASNVVTPQGAQTITFTNPGDQPIDTAPTLTASASSGLTVVFSSSTPGVCTITSGGALTFLSTGACTIAADQAGDTTYLPAPQVSQTFQVEAVVPGAPTIGTAAVTGAGQVQVSFTAPGYDGGAAISSYTVTSAPGGITASGSGSPITVAGLTPGVSYTFTVTASNSAGVGPASGASNAVVPVPALVANPVTASVAYGAVDAPIALDITGTPASVAVSGAASHGTVTASGTTIVYTPTPGYAGPDSFSYTASDAYTTSPAATVTITVGAPTLVLGPASLPAGNGSAAYAQTLSTSGGAAPYHYAASGALPPGLTLTAGGELAGTPAAAGSFSFDVTSTDSSTGDGPFAVTRSYTLVVNAPALTVDALPPGTGGQAYQQQLTAHGGAAPYHFAIVGGALPSGLALSESGEVTGTPDAAGTFDYTLQITDANGFEGTQEASLLIEAGQQVIQAFVATPTAPVYSPNGTFAVSATGGASGKPVVFASATPEVCAVDGATVTMLAAGLCTITADQAGDAAYQAAPQLRLDVNIAMAVPVLGWIEDLSKTYGDAAFDLPDPQSSSPGTFSFASSDSSVATVNGRTVTLVGEGTAILTATQAATANYTSASAEVRLVVSARPDPTADPRVVSGVQAQVDATVRFAQAQSDNIRGRLRQIRNGRVDSSVNLALAYAGSRGVPGFSVPLGRAAGAVMPRMPEGWGMWMAGTATFGQAGRGGLSGGGFDFNTGGITLGIDHAVGENLLLGMAGSWGRQNTDFDDTTSRVDANQRSLAFYGLWRAGKSLFLDGILATGRLDFDTVRWSDLVNAAARGRRDGDQWFGSLTFGHERLNPSGMTLTTYGRYDWHRATLDGYRESGLGAFDLVYGRQRLVNTALALGLEGSLMFKRPWGSLRPHWTMEYRSALENRGDVLVNYVQRPASNDYVLGLNSYNDDLLSLGAGVDVQLDSGWTFSFLLGHEQGRDSMHSNSVGLQLRYGQSSSMPIDGDGVGGMSGDRRGCRRQPQGCPLGGRSGYAADWP